MQPGPSIIRKCSACGKLIEQETLGSWNTFGDQSWTDGMNTPIFPNTFQLVKCGHCATLILIDEQKKVGEIEQPWLNNGYFKGCRPYKTPSVQDCLAALEIGKFDKETKRYIRFIAWWTGNSIRRGEENPPPLSKDEIANLRSLTKLLNESDEQDRFLKAEIMRELGNFDKAMELLSKPHSRKLARIAKILKKLVEQKNPFVQEID